MQMAGRAPEDFYMRKIKIVVCNMKLVASKKYFEPFQGKLLLNK